MQTQLSIDGNLFKDQAGRIAILRGINLGGSSKIPKTPDGATHRASSYQDPQSVSFIGRPFPLNDVDEHLSRLKSWGFNVIRLLTTWEAIEHAGPQQYDTGYLSYLRDIVEAAGDYGFWVIIDPHQDTWSRFTGGDGAPAWVFDKVGLDWQRFDNTDAALLMYKRYPSDYLPLEWVSNNHRFAAATMFTLFFGGTDFAPKVHVEGIPVQTYLQDHYINAMLEVVDLLKDYSHVLGYGCMNEPSPGYIGVQDLTQVDARYPPGLQINGFDGMVAASGISRRVPYAELKGWRMKQAGKRTINPSGVSVWNSTTKAIWQQHGIWRTKTPTSDSTAPVLVKPHYFAKVKRKAIDFTQDYLKPFILQFTHQVRKSDPNAWIFVESIPNQVTTFNWKPEDPTNMVNAPHWYDAVNLATKKSHNHISYDIFTNKRVYTAGKIYQMYLRQLDQLRSIGETLSNAPSILGEFGIPYDMNDKQAYLTNDFSKQFEALQRAFQAIDDLFLSAILWNYNADNSNEWGDEWNLEDFSIFSRDQQTDPNDINSGGRAIKAFCRPYPRFIAGTPLQSDFNSLKGVYTLDFDASGNVDVPTEIYVPRVQYPKGYTVQSTSGRYERNPTRQSLNVFISKSGPQQIRITRI